MTIRKLSTPVEMGNPLEIFSPESQYFTIGSCFAEQMGSMLADHYFKGANTPLGTLYNPISICKSLDRLLSKTFISEEEIEHTAGRYFHYDYHTQFSASDSEAYISKINKTLLSASDALIHTDLLIITLGTSIAYHLDGKVVANCHKMPAHQFTKSFISESHMLAMITSVIEKLFTANPKVQVIFTVSPVRHTKEGLVENNRSKSRLISLCHCLSDMDRCTYFPSYEILMDELRDYRYYADDLIHPSRLAIDIIGDRFRNRFFNESAHQYFREVRKLNKNIQHSPFDPQADAFLTFCKSQLKTIEKLEQEYPHLSLRAAWDHFEGFLT